MGATAPLLALSAASTYSQYQGQRAQADLEGRMFDINRTNAEVMASEAIKRGGREATALKTRTRRLIGSQRAAQAASGVDIGSGSAVDVQEDTRVQGERDALTIKNNAWREAFGIRSEAAAAGTRQNLSRLSRRNEMANTLLTGGLQFATYARGRK
jgi:hypothetical protein